jgi:hypothetical protein
MAMSRPFDTAIADAFHGFAPQERVNGVSSEAGRQIMQEIIVELRRQRRQRKDAAPLEGDDEITAALERLLNLLGGEDDPTNEDADMNDNNRYPISDAQRQRVVDARAAFVSYCFKIRFISSITALYSSCRLLRSASFVVAVSRCKYHVSAF